MLLKESYQEKSSLFHAKLLRQQNTVAPTNALKKTHRILYFRRNAQTSHLQIIWSNKLRICVA